MTGTQAQSLKEPSLMMGDGGEVAKRARRVQGSGREYALDTESPPSQSDRPCIHEVRMSGCWSTDDAFES